MKNTGEKKRYQEMQNHKKNKVGSEWETMKIYIGVYYLYELRRI